MFSYQCSFLLLPFHATAFILYQSVSCLSTTFLFLFCCCEAVPHATALIEYHIPPSLSTAFFFVHFVISACHSLVSVSISERMLSYHGFPELSMLFLYFAQFRIFRHFCSSVFLFRHPVPSLHILLLNQSNCLVDTFHSNDFDPTNTLHTIQ